MLVACQNNTASKNTTSALLKEIFAIHRLTLIMYTLHNHNEQFFQVGLLEWALISLGLALSPPSTSVSLDFMVLCKCLKIYLLLTSLYLVEAWWD